MELAQIQKILAADTVRLWLVLGKEEWELAEQRGELREFARNIDSYEKSAYRWLMDRMRVYVPGYKGKYPVWVFGHKPDFRGWSWRWGFGGEPIVRVELELPREEVLFFEESAVLCLFHPYYLSTNELDDMRFEAFCELIQARDKSETTRACELIQTELEDSWYRMFDFELLSQDPEWHGELYLQAVVERVPLSAVKKVEHFTLSPASL